jgi:hypothetical protein
MKPRRSAARQRGLTLIVALIMLVALALLAVWAVNTSTVNTRIVGNTQVRAEALAAAQEAVEETISSDLFPTSVNATVNVDVDGDGSVDYTAALTPKPTCNRVRVVKVSEIDPTLASGRQCLQSSSSSGPSIEVVGSAPPTGNSLCADAEWNVRVVATDTRSSANTAVNQGIADRDYSIKTENACP